MTLDELEPMLDRKRAEIAERGEGFDVVLAPEPPIDAVGNAGEVERTLQRYGAAGATKLNLRFRHDSLAGYIEQLEAMAVIAERTGWA
jgi:hypothetical protein